MVGGNVSDRSISAGDDTAWAERCEYWADEPTEPKHRGRPPRHANRPLVITGHGMRLNIHHGTLLIESGFTHYPQERLRSKKTAPRWCSI
jgi:hypothetical protein